MSETATLSGLFIYPVKSARGIAREHVRLTPLGLEWDRQWMIVDERGVFLTQRTHPQLARLVPRIEVDALVLMAPELSELRVPLEAAGEALEVRVWADRVRAITQGPHSDEWLSWAVGQPVRLVRVAEAMAGTRTRSTQARCPRRSASPTAIRFLSATALPSMI